VSVDADRHLLFGLIALQVGLIDPCQLVAAFQSLARDKSRPLADHLAARGDMDADGRAAVESMVRVHIWKHGGDVEKSLANIPAGRSTRESLAAVGGAEPEGGPRGGDLGEVERARAIRRAVTILARPWRPVRLRLSSDRGLPGRPG
jgi:hypothetical protein